MDPSLVIMEKVTNDIEVINILILQILIMNYRIWFYIVPWNDLEEGTFRMLEVDNRVLYLN